MRTGSFESALNEFLNIHLLKFINLFEFNLPRRQKASFDSQSIRVVLDQHDVYLGFLERHVKMAH
ncbi:MAG: hypothetical protein RL462_209 [Pseudomonadota bacterium]|jgi:hypothetical protein